MANKNTIAPNSICEPQNTLESKFIIKYHEKFYTVFLSIVQFSIYKLSNSCGKYIKLGKILTHYALEFTNSYFLKLNSNLKYFQNLKVIFLFVSEKEKKVNLFCLGNYIGQMTNSICTKAHLWKFEKPIFFFIFLKTFSFFKNTLSVLLLLLLLLRSPTPLHPSHLLCLPTLIPILIF